jgi:hypothetical protein
MFPAIIQFNYQINLPEKEVALYVSQFRAARKNSQAEDAVINPEELELFITSRRENLLSIQSLSDLKKDTSFDIQDIQAEVTLARENDFTITLTLFLKEFIILGQFTDEDFLISTIDHLPDMVDRKPIPVKKLHNFKSLTMNTYQLIRLN